MNHDEANSVKQLFQVTPPNTNAYSVFSKVAKRKVTFTSITVVNTTANAAVYSIFLDRDGTTYNASTAIATNVALSANSVALYEWIHGQPMDYQFAGNLAVSVGTANAITFTGVGIES